MTRRKVIPFEKFVFNRQQAPCEMPVLLFEDRAIKIIPSSDTSADYDTSYKLEAEVCELLALEGHPNIMKVFGVHHWGDYTVIEMERLSPIHDADYLEKGFLSLGIIARNCAELGDIDDAMASIRCRYRNQPWLLEKYLQDSLAACQEIYPQVRGAIEYLTSLGYTHTDTHHENWMEDVNGAIKMIDMDHVDEV